MTPSIGSNGRNAGGRGSAGNHAERVVRVLLAHGVPESQARVLLPIADALRAQALQMAAEHAASFDIDTAQPAGPLRAGTRSEVDVTDQVRAMRPDRRYVSIHTHHQSTAFSDRDVELLLRNAAIRTIIAIGHDGTWYLLSKLSDGTTVSPATVAAAFASAMRVLSPHFLRLATQGVVTREEALRRVLHQVWRVIAPPLGLRYDRVRGPRSSNGIQTP